MADKNGTPALTPTLIRQLVANCECWVASRSDEERFGIRYGAHCVGCPAFRMGLDPVDRANDAELHAGSCGRARRIGPFA